MYRHKRFLYRFMIVIIKWITQFDNWSDQVTSQYAKKQGRQDQNTFVEESSKSSKQNRTMAYEGHKLYERGKCIFVFLTQSLDTYNIGFHQLSNKKRE